jgi:hypothetical protein
MAPRTRQHNTTVETAPVVPAANTSVRPKSAKKSKEKKTHQTQESLPSLTIRVPQGLAAAGPGTFLYDVEVI